MKWSPSTRLPISRPCMSVKATTTVSIAPVSISCASSSLVSGALAVLGFGSVSTSLPPLSRPGDEALEKLRRPRQVDSELLRVALDGDDEPVVRFQPLDRPVLAAGALVEPRRDGLDRLVVEAVDLDRGTAG